jgi:hypothetical protein
MERIAASTEEAVSRRTAATVATVAAQSASRTRRQWAGRRLNFLARLSGIDDEGTIERARPITHHRGVGKHRSRSAVSLSTLESHQSAVERFGPERQLPHVSCSVSDFRRLRIFAFRMAGSE